MCASASERLALPWVLVFQLVLCIRAIFSFGVKPLENLRVVTIISCLKAED